MARLAFEESWFARRFRSLGKAPFAEAAAMTIVRNDGADAFVRRPPPDMRLFLAHGLDEGLIHERARALVNAILAGDKDPLRLARFDGDALAREPGKLADEAYAISMFGDSRAIWIDAGSRDLAPLFEPLFARPPSDCAIVVEAGNLKKGSPLRTAFESASNAASVECYADDKRALAALIEAEAREARLAIAPEARDYLASLLGTDRMTSRGEVAKLMLYAAGSGKVEVADIEAIVTDAAPAEVDAAIDQALLGNVREVETTAGRFFADGGDAGFLLIRLAARVTLLHRIRLEMDAGRSFDGAAQALFVRLSKEGRDALARQARLWSAAALGRRLPAIQTVAARGRRDARLARALATRALWALATGARAGGRG
jgi:DNA polymerase-3 subunit delta